MCLGMPTQIIEIIDKDAKVSIGGTDLMVSIDLIEDIAVGDYVLVHAGFALQKISEEEALENLKTFEEFEKFNKELDDEEEKTGQRIV